jgi:hypothetical protein
LGKRTRYACVAIGISNLYSDSVSERQLQVILRIFADVTKEASMRVLSWLAMLASFVAGVIATALYS